MLTCRDHSILLFIKQFGIAPASAVHDVFFENQSLRRCQQRLTKLVKAGELHRERSFYCQTYLYYIGKKPKQIEHRMQRLNAYLDLKRRFTVAKFVPEYEYSDLRPDAYVELWDDGNIEPFFLEIQQNTHFDQGKYEKAFCGNWHEQWETFPKVIVLTDQRLKLRLSEVKYVIVQDIKKAPI